MKTIAALAMASATIVIPPVLAGARMFSASGHVVRPMFVGVSRGNYGSASASRPDRFAGEESIYRKSVNISAGSFSVGDFAAIGSRSHTRLVEDILVGAALVLQSVQSPMEREIQAIASAKFESYWD